MKRYTMLLATALLLHSAACSSKKATGKCKSNANCTGGEVCLQTGCAAICVGDADCDSSLLCDGGVCIKGARSGFPEILAIDGDGPTETDVTHADHFILSSLLITGRNLTGTTVELKGMSNHLLTVADGATDSQLTALLPTDLSEGDYWVVVTNQLGPDQAEITVLQGIQGPAGSDANLDASQIVSRINASGEVINAANLNAVAPTDPRLISATRMTTIRVTAGSARSVVLNGTPVTLPNNTLDGISLVVVDAATHTVRSDLSTTGPSFLHTFDGSSSLAAQQLASMLQNDIAATDIVILATLGSAHTFLDDWIAAGQSVGASHSLARTSSTGGYLLIGRKQMGRGNGLEVTGAVDAQVTTLLVDGDLVGLKAQPARNFAWSKGTGSSLTCNAPYQGTTAWSSIASVLPARSLRTGGGPIKAELATWNYTTDAAVAYFRVVVDPGSASEVASSTCSGSAVYNSGVGDNPAGCTIILEGVAAGLHTVEVQWYCADNGSSGTNPDVTLRCNNPDACTMFVEEL